MLWEPSKKRRGRALIKVPRRGLTPSSAPAWRKARLWLIRSLERLTSRSPLSRRRCTLPQRLPVAGRLWLTSTNRPDAPTRLQTPVIGQRTSKKRTRKLPTRVRRKVFRLGQISRPNDPDILWVALFFLVSVSVTAGLFW